MAPNAQAESAPSARRARMPLAASAGAPGRPRTSGAMRRPLLLRHTTRTRRHAREQSRLCSCAKEVLRTPRHCQVVGNTRGDASLVEREHQGHQPQAARVTPSEGSAGRVDEGLAGAPPSVCSRATSLNSRRNAYSRSSRTRWPLRDCGRSFNPQCGVYSHTAHCNSAGPYVPC